MTAHLIKRLVKPFIFPLSFLLLSGCGHGAVTDKPAWQDIHIVIEEGEGFTAAPSAFTVSPGSDALVTLYPLEGYEILGTDYEEGALTLDPAGRSAVLTLKNIRYSESISVEVKAPESYITYVLDRAAPDKASGSVRLPVSHTHLRPNTAPYQHDFMYRDGYTLAGWSHVPDPDLKSGLVSPGSRIPLEWLSRDGSTAPDTLYACWVPWSDPDCFSVSPNGDGLTITGLSPAGQAYLVSRKYSAFSSASDTSASSGASASSDASVSSSVVSIPASIDGRPVTSIGEGALAGLLCDTLILPPSIRSVELYAFENSSFSELILFDGIRKISDYSFAGCEALRTLRICAMEAPAYSATYYNTFPDKYDRLLSLADSPRIILFSGSSARFGYDSRAIDEAFPAFDVVNMGVFAYTNALPQLDLILQASRSGDILVESPEFDAAKRQFCTTHAMDDKFFNLIEGDYDLIRRLNLQSYDGVFDSLQTFLSVRQGLQRGNYSLSPSDFDEDGKPVSSPSYNEYGDYIVYRPNADTDEPVFGLPLDYTATAFPDQVYLKSLNQVNQTFLDRGVRVFFTYAPRNSLALSPESTPDKRRELHEYFCAGLTVPVISDIEASLYPGHLLYGTDNHLSTQGASMRTRQFIADLQTAMEAP